MITISPGHWAPGTGAKDFICEVTEARKVARRVVEILWGAGVKTTYVEDNTSKTKQQNLAYLVKQHNKTSRQLDVSVHFNASGRRESKGKGTEVLYYDAKDLAGKISKAIANVSGLIDRGAKQRKELAFLAKTNKPAVLIELCFVNSTVDVAIYQREFEKICQAIAKELAKAVGKTLKIPTSASTEEKKEDVQVTYKKDEKPSTWAKASVEWAKENKVSDGTYLKRPATREEVLTMIYNARKVN